MVLCSVIHLQVINVLVPKFLCKALNVMCKLILYHVIIEAAYMTEVAIVVSADILCIEIAMTPVVLVTWGELHSVWSVTFCTQILTSVVYVRLGASWLHSCYFVVLFAS